MARHRRLSNTSSASSLQERNQELASMYDYLAKVILLGPSGTGKSCLLHRFVRNEWRILSSQTIGVEFSSKIVKIGTGPQRKRIKLQLWDTAGTERFRSVSRSYYRGAAGAILVYDVSSHTSFTALPTFLMDARALASPNLTLILAGNKSDLIGESGLNGSQFDTLKSPAISPSAANKQSSIPLDTGANGSMPRSIGILGAGMKMTATTAPLGREVGIDEASNWAAKSNIPVTVEVSALSGENVDELFNRLARIILTKIELGEIDPGDPQSGIQYGDEGPWGIGSNDGASVRSGMTVEDGPSHPYSKKHARRGGASTRIRGMGNVFRLSQNRNRQCC